MGKEKEEHDQQCARCKSLGVVERESAQQAAAREVPGVVKCKSAQQAAAREEPAAGRREEENDQCVLGRQANLKETSEGKELAKLRLQVLEVGKQVMLVNPKRKL